MWEKLLDYGKQLFSITAKIAKHEEDIKELQQDVKAVREDIRSLRQEMSDLTRVVERVIFEVQKDREMARRDHENLLLRLEIAFLRSGNILPPSTDADTTKQLS
ncbi:MAG: hypothetical protein H7Y38_16545 [Armatimonadetes bacterium]|nr:hypothetical protein [Armatimonadota bacterium]